MHDSPHPRLLGDIGGTNARFAWQVHPDAPPSDVVTYQCSAHASLLDAIQHYLAEQGKPSPRQCAIGMANPITGDRVRMTNHHWSFSISALQRDLGLERLAVINDFTALALSLPALTAADLRPIGGGAAAPGAPLAVLGPGTGLGVSGLLPVAPGRFVPINGEGGHVTLAAADDREAAVLEQLRRRFGHASAERALSGPGLVNLYDAVCALSGGAALALGPAEVIERARTGADPCSVEALDLFCSFLGSVAGNLALTLGARGGVYIGGGIAPRLIAEIERSSFRTRFEAKGRFRDYLRGIPTLVIDAAVSPALLGAARALDDAVEPAAG
jgi:glucokinase